MIDYSVVRIAQGVTHFSPGSYESMPTCETPIPNMFMSGDWVISHHGSFSQGEDHFMTKPFFSQLLSLSSVRLSIVYEAFFCYIIVFVVGSFVDCIYVTVTSHPSRGVCKAKHPRGSRVVYPLVSLEVSTPLFFVFVRNRLFARKYVKGAEVRRTSGS